MHICPQPISYFKFNEITKLQMLLLLKYIWILQFQLRRILYQISRQKYTNNIFISQINVDICITSRYILERGAIHVAMLLTLWCTWSLSQCDSLSVVPGRLNNTQGAHPGHRRHCSSAGARLRHRARWVLSSRLIIKHVKRLDINFHIAKSNLNINSSLLNNML